MSGAAGLRLGVWAISAWGETRAKGAYISKQRGSGSCNTVLQEKGTDDTLSTRKIWSLTWGGPGDCETESVKRL